MRTAVAARLAAATALAAAAACSERSPVSAQERDVRAADDMLQGLRQELRLTRRDGGALAYALAVIVPSQCHDFTGPGETAVETGPDGVDRVVARHRIAVADGMICAQALTRRETEGTIMTGGRPFRILVSDADGGALLDFEGRWP